VSDLSFLKDWIRHRALPEQDGDGDGAGEMVREFEQFFRYIFLRH